MYLSLRKVNLFVLTAVIGLSGCIGNLAGRKDLDALDELRRTDPKTAVTKLKQHLESKPRDDMAWTILGHAYEDLDQDDEAETAYKKALEINPRRFDALTGMGILSRKKGNYDQALDYYEQALAIDPKYAQAYSSMTVIALKKNDDKKALEYAKKGYDLDKEDPVIVANLAVAYHYNGMVELRDKMTREARKLGYKNINTLEKIYSGEMTVRD